MCLSIYRDTSNPTGADSKTIQQSSSFADKIKNLEKDDSETEFDENERMDVDELVNYINGAGRNGIYDEYYGIRSQPPSGTFERSR